MLYEVITAGFSAYDSRISSANFNENEILTENESLDIFKILSADKIFRLDSLINDFSIRTRFRITSYNVCYTKLLPPIDG